MFVTKHFKTPLELWNRFDNLEDGISNYNEVQKINLNIILFSVIDVTIDINDSYKSSRYYVVSDYNTFVTSLMNTPKNKKCIYEVSKTIRE